MEINHVKIFKKKRERKPSPKLFLMIKCAMDHKKEFKFFNLRILPHQSIIMVFLGIDLHLGEPVGPLSETPMVCLGVEISRLGVV